MNMKYLKFKRTAIVLAAIYATSVPGLSHADWSFTILGSLGGETFATAINDSGQVVGRSTDHAFMTGPNGVGMIDLNPYSGPGSSSSVATGINNSGQVTGTWRFFEDRSPGGHKQDTAFITGANGVGFTDLGAFGGPASSANGINDSGQVTGVFYDSSDGSSHAYITGSNGVGMTDLDIFNLTPYSISGINDDGQVVGQYADAQGYHAFITDANGTGVTELDALGGPTGHTTGINNSGQVVGAASFTDHPLFSSYERAFITGFDGIGMTDLGTVSGGLTSHATAINDSGEVVGVFGGHAFLYSHGGMTNLSLLDSVVASGLKNIQPIDINNNGQIVGIALGDAGRYQSFLLLYTPDTVSDPQPIFIPISPVPEPETYAMLLAGLCLIGFMVRRRKVADV